MNLELLPYKDRLVQLAFVCTELLGIGVIIVDKHLNQLINTFHYNYQPRDIQVSSVVGSVIVTGEPVIMRERRLSNECQACPEFHSCGIERIIGVPILAESECIGVVALLISPDQAKVLDAKFADIMNLMEQMAWWIANTIQNGIYKEHLNDFQQRAFQMFDVISNPVVIADEDLQICFCNDAFCEFFGTAKFHVPGENLQRSLQPYRVNRSGSELAAGTLYFGKSSGLVRLSAIQDIKLSLQDPERVRAYVFERTTGIEAILDGRGGAEKETIDRLLGPSADMQATRHGIEIAAKNDLPVLIEGHDQIQVKKLVRMVHQVSSARRQSLFQIDCRAQTKDLEDFLFGISEDIPGVPWLSKGCTLCLWQINHMPLYIQNRFADYICDSRMFEKYGTIARIVATSDDSLESLVKKNRFSRQLLSQISQNHIAIPDIKDHTEDIYYYLNQFVAEFSSPYCYDPAQIDRTEWPEIFRKNLPADYLTLKQLAELQIIQQQDGTRNWNQRAAFTNARQRLPLGVISKETRLREMLEAGEDKQTIAKELNISRATLYRWIEKYQLTEYKQTRTKV